MRARMQTLGEDKLARWHELAPQQKLAMHVDRLEVEADAQRQILRLRTWSCIRALASTSAIRRVATHLHAFESSRTMLRGVAISCAPQRLAVT